MPVTNVGPQTPTARFYTAWTHNRRSTGCSRQSKRLHVTISNEEIDHAKKHFGIESKRCRNPGARCDVEGTADLNGARGSGFHRRWYGLHELTRRRFTEEQSREPVPQTVWQRAIKRVPISQFPKNRNQRHGGRKRDAYAGSRMPTGENPNPPPNPSAP